MKRFLLAAAAATAVVAPSAAAETVKYKRFASPSGQIHCYALKYGGEGIECMAPYLRDRGDLDTYLALEPRGKSRYGERGDFPGYPNSRERTLRYGDTWKRNGIRCKMRESGLTCRNKDDHGFRMAKGDVRRF